MSKEHALRISLFAVAGLLISLAYILAVGLLATQAVGAREGAVLDLNNTLISIAEPHVPYVQMISIAFLGLLVASALIVGTRHQHLRDRLALSAGFSTGTAALVAYSFAGIDVSSAKTSIVEEALAGWKGWIHEAGSNSSVHLLLALMLGWTLLQVLQASRTPRLAERNAGAQ